MFSGRKRGSKLPWIGGAMYMLLLAASGCSTQTTKAPAADPQIQRVYTIGRGDTLEVIVWGEDKVSGQVNVRPDGMVTVALIGDVPAAGRSPDELAGQIKDGLTRYIDKPNVVVRVLATGSRRFFVIGNVRTPGSYDMGANQTLLKALAMAGGLNEFASAGSLRIIRDGGTSMLEPDYWGITRGEVPDVRLEPEDTIVVP